MILRMFDAGSSRYGAPLVGTDATSNATKGAFSKKSTGRSLEVEVGPLASSAVLLVVVSGVVVVLGVVVVVSGVVVVVVVFGVVGLCLTSAGNLWPALAARMTSPFVTRPPFPDPAKAVASQPFDSDRNRAAGDSRNLLSPFAGGGAGPSSSLEGAWASPEGAAVRNSSRVAFSKAPTSAASSTVITMGAPTAVSVPAWTKIFAMTPSSWAS
mmetsp:Transcript_14585/g.47519  ORF Transcript_14585/g.47519 Transcript_14585/m.47519 type:complete len:212 (-) Transcript_14585:61-696(-)